MGELRVSEPRWRIRIIELALEGALLLTVVGSVLAIGSVHPWAYVPLWWASGALAFLVVLRAIASSVNRRATGARNGIATGLGLVNPLRALHAPPPLFIPGLLFALWVVIQLLPLRAGRPFTESPADTLRGLVFVLAVLGIHLAAAVVLERREARDRFRGALTLLTLLLGITALFQFVSGTTRVYGLFETWEGGAVFGPFGNRNHFAAYMLMLVPLALDRVRYAWKRYREQSAVRPDLKRRLIALGTPAGTRLLYSLLPAAAGIAALIATTSRGALLAFVACIGLAFLAHRRASGAPLWSLGAAFLFVLVAWFGVERLETRFVRWQIDAPSRTEVWTDALARMDGHWLTGFGFNTFGFAVSHVLPFELPRGATPWPPEVLAAVARGERPAQRRPAGLPGSAWYREAHNDYVQTLVETGVPGLLLGLWAAGAVLLGARTRPWLLAALAGVLLHVLVDFDLQIPAIGVLFATLSAWPRRSAGRSPGDARLTSAH